MMTFYNTSRAFSRSLVLASPCCFLYALCAGSAAPAKAASIPDQGQIFGATGIVELGVDHWSQSITTGVGGELTDIQFQFERLFSAPLPGTFDLALLAGGNPSTGGPLFSEQVTIWPDELTDDVYTWDVSAGDLAFDVGDEFTFAFNAHQTGYVIAGNDFPGYSGGELFQNGSPLPNSAVGDIAFISHVRSAIVPDQGQIYSTDGIVELGTDDWSQSITTGIGGQLTGLQFQFEQFFSAPLPGTFDLAVFAGENPPVGSPLFSEKVTIFPDELTNYVYTWDVTAGELTFEVGEEFTFALSAEDTGYVIAANDGPGYDGGELFTDGVPLPNDGPNDIAFISYVKEDAIAPLPGDFNADLRVDGLDFLYWQGDQAVGELTDWEINFGGAAATETLIAIPEPSTFALLATLLFALVAQPRLPQ